MQRKSFVFWVTVFLLTGSVTVSAITRRATIRVEGMDCKGCSVSVEKALKATPGVSKAEVSLERKEAVVEYDDEKVTEVRLREVIDDTGFKAVAGQSDHK